MEAIDIHVEPTKGERLLRVSFKTTEGDIVILDFRKKLARRLMRAIFLQIGVDPRYGAGKDTLPDYVEGLGKEL